MAYYHTCLECGAHLDPGEDCDCKLKEWNHQEVMAEKIKANPKTGQYAFQFETHETGGIGKASCLMDKN